MDIVSDVQNTGFEERTIDNLTRRALKASEETGELAEAVLSFTSASKGKGKTFMDVIEEACDVVILGLDVALTKPPGMEDLSDELWRTVVKNLITTKLAKWQDQLDNNNSLYDDGEVIFDPSEIDAFLPEVVVPSVCHRQDGSPTQESAATRAYRDAAYRTGGQ